MSEPLPDLESRRSQILLEIAHLDDCRRGSVHAAFRRSGKPNCAYASDDHPGHGPQVRLSFKRHGKTVQQTLSDPAQIRKAEREVAAFRSFQQLSAELVAVNERICQLRPQATHDLEPASAAPKKNATRDPERRPGRGREPAESDRQRPAQARRGRPRSPGTGDPHSPAQGAS